MKNKVYLVGAGPGSPDLITVRGKELLRQADVVIYDYLVDKRILNYAKTDAELICCDKLGKSRYSDGFLKDNKQVFRLVIKKARQGKKVIRLKNGDVSVFSRTSQELEPLIQNKLDFELVPGVPAAVAAGALSGITLTDRRLASNVVFITGHEDPTKKQSSLNWEALSKCATICLYMAVGNLSRIVKQLIEKGKGKDVPVAIIEDVSLLTQRLTIGRLGNINKKAKENNVRPPAIIIIGQVVNLNRKFNWLTSKKRVLFTGISQQRFFEDKIYFHLPLIKIVPLRDYRKFDRGLKDIADYDWIVFSSRYGAEYFFQRLNAIGLDARELSQAKVAAIGNSTANKLIEFRIISELIPKDESSKGLIEAFKKIDIRDKKIFIPRSDISDKGLVQALESQGARVTALVAYKNIMPKDLPRLDLNLFGEVRFTSPSGVRNFIKRYGRVPRNIKVSYIGEVTKLEAEKWNLQD